MVLVGGVGDRTSNLFNPSILVAGYHLDSSGLLSPYTRRCATVQPISINCNSLILKFDTNVNDVKFIYSLFNNDTLVRREAAKISGETIDTTGANKIYICFYNSTPSTAALLPSDITNVMLSENDIDYEPYGYKVPVVVSGKNFLNNVASTGTFQGVKFTINEDKSITLNGTASNNAWFTVQYNNVLDVGQYILTGAVNNTVLRYQKNSTGYAYDDTGAGRNINITQKITSGLISLKITENVFYDNITIYPMIRLATIEDDTYEPYIEPTITNIYLDETIGANESISLSDTNTNIQTVRGTNVLTVDTTVQPRKVYVKVRKESSHEAQIRQLYESVNAELTQYKAQYGELGGE